jgi:hypothetical protein
VRGLREQVCGALAPWNRGGDSNKPIENDEDGACIVLKIQGHWEHWGLFYRYREFIKVNSVLTRSESTVFEKIVHDSFCLQDCAYINCLNPVEFLDFIHSCFGVSDLAGAPC